MDHSPQKSAWVNTLRQPFYMLEKFLPGRVNPNFWTVAMIVSSVLYLYCWQFKPWNIAFITLSLIFDWLDGAYARKQKSTSLEGHVIDITFDKISEVLILVPLLGSWFGFAMLGCFIANLYFTKRIFKTGKHFHLNIRLFTILYLLFI